MAEKTEWSKLGDISNEALAGECLRRLRENAVSEFALELSTQLKREHRTHQQLIMGGLKNIIIWYADHGTDLRNEASVRWAKEVRGNTYRFTAFPYV